MNVHVDALWKAVNVKLVRDVSDVVSDGDGSLSRCVPKIKQQLVIWV